MQLQALDYDDDTAYRWDEIVFRIQNAEFYADEWDDLDDSETF